MCESDMVTLRRAEAQVQYTNCAESALIMHVYFTHCASARDRALQKNKVRLGIHLRREWDCIYCLIQCLCHVLSVCNFVLRNIQLCHRQKIVNLIYLNFQCHLYIYKE